MTARDSIHAMLPLCDSLQEAEAREAELDRRLDAVVAETRAEARAEAFAEAAAFVGNDDTCDCGGCDTCHPRKLAEGLREMARGKATAPAATDTPGFFQKGHTYRNDGGLTYEVLAISRHPRHGTVYAIGWLISTGSCLVVRMSQSNWDSGKWTDVTEEVTR